MTYGLVLKLHPNNHPDPLSPSEEIQQKSVDKTGGVTETKVVERDSRVMHLFFFPQQDKVTPN